MCQTAGGVLAKLPDDFQPGNAPTPSSGGPIKSRRRASVHADAVAIAAGSDVFLIVHDDTGVLLLLLLLLLDLDLRGVGDAGRGLPDDAQ